MHTANIDTIKTFSITVGFAFKAMFLNKIIRYEVRKKTNITS